jgi:hypothetical protein
MNTAFLLMAHYNAQPIIPVEAVCQDFFQPLTLKKFLEYIAAGKINLPLMRLYPDAKSAKGVHLQDLAEYLDAQREAAVKECRQLQR